MLKRTIDALLKQWKKSTARRVLLMRGARQVGKTFSVRKLAESYQSFIEVNFLETPELKSFFQSGSLSPNQITEKLQAYFGTTLYANNSLLFLDEIQECPEALNTLRFFQEKMPELHVIGAGSLLEFALEEIPSFGVGRIESLFLYPLSLEEFFLATGDAHLLEVIKEASPRNPLDPPLHAKALELLKTYSLIGGLPAVVQSYIDTKDISLSLSLISQIVLSYEDDFAKYKTRIAPEKLRQTLLSVAQQSGSKFIYSQISPENSPSGYQKSFDLLHRAGLIYKVNQTSANGIPLGAEVNPKHFKAIPFDIGFYNVLLGIHPSKLLLQDDYSFVHQGALAEILCGTELVAHSPATQKPHLYYWRREARGSNAEIDYLISQGREILPIEVKSGTKGKMQSLYLFLSQKQYPRGIRTSLENFTSYRSPNNSSEILVIPLYAIGTFAGGS
ncbi:MAG: ATP-binding protein [Bdellovibrionales bacterium]|nr:ATP-binding protein [Bdellovibrionales bacterium]